jgi:hypothetical protein
MFHYLEVKVDERRDNLRMKGVQKSIIAESE